MKKIRLLIVLGLVLLLSTCAPTGMSQSTPTVKIIETPVPKKEGLNLGLTPHELIKEYGRPADMGYCQIQLFGTQDVVPGQGWTWEFLSDDGIQLTVIRVCIYASRVVSEQMTRSSLDINNHIFENQQIEFIDYGLLEILLNTPLFPTAPTEPPVPGAPEWEV